jgi:riboflavin-specific deaminase-like protein
MAMTADGRIATTRHAFSRFGSARDGARLYALRATADAILCGATTLRMEQATLELAPGRAARRSPGPLRVVVTGRGTLSPKAAVFRQGAAPVCVLITEQAPARARERLRRVATEVCVAGRKTVDWPRALAWLAERHGVRRLLCEGGGTLNAALFQAGLVHELRLTICPWLVGGRRAPTLAEGDGVARLAEGRRLELKSRRQVGDELFLVYTVPDALPPRD